MDEDNPEVHIHDERHRYDFAPYYSAAPAYSAFAPLHSIIHEVSIVFTEWTSVALVWPDMPDIRHLEILPPPRSSAINPFHAHMLETISVRAANLDDPEADIALTQRCLPACQMKGITENAVTSRRLLTRLVCGMILAVRAQRCRRIRTPERSI